ncbi:NADH-quinone oxidoreductase subunit L [Oleisolibacter albus]|uniref:NADH-quinone oxidoreductase subunit L n=1 Tax=Oleisolibacter albus TaxID=2171757 RepID=UPI000DF2B4DE|nr:NADH-quinone oxidoreductase subunit L [Oleisolibacter albus]
MEIAAIFLPLAAAFIAGFFGRFIGDRGAQIVTCAAVLAAAAISVMLFMQIGLGGPEAARTVELFTWIDSGSFEVSWALRLDTLTAVMLVVVNGVSAMVHVYSVGYMSHDPSKARFMAYLSLFTFMMLMLVTADNLLQMFFGWEGVGLASYLLINFWFHKTSANDASMKAFLVNRVGDFGFALGIMAVFLIFGTIQFDQIFAQVAAKADLSINFLGFQVHALTCACLLLFVGAMGKSAQLGLHTWLPDAMEGPTPVSALIHAATMVTAGVFMLARMSPVFEYAPAALSFVTVMGALTAIVAATIGMTQFDIKRVIAYSTMSQLGYMFFAIGVGAYPAAVFHLMTHAFFKALLFLGAGSVIHAMSDEQDMRNMGGIWKLIPVTYVMMWIGNLALAGIPFFAGYYSKDMILEVAYAKHTAAGSFAFWLGLGAALMTAFYSWRLLILTFHGRPRANETVMAHVHESPLVMLLPLCVLAVGALFSGWVAYDWFVGHDWAEFWGESILMRAGEHGTIIDAAHHVPAWVPLSPFIAGLIGIALAYLFYMIKPDLPGQFVGAFRSLHGIVFRKYYFDELYNALFVKPAMALGFGLWKGGDQVVIDGFGPDGAARVTRGLSVVASRLQTGYVFHYAFVMVIGVVALVGWFWFR